MKPRLMALLVLACLAGGTARAADPLAAVGGQLAAGNYAAALSTLDRLEARAAAGAQARFLRGAALAGSGRLDEAVRQFEVLIADHPQLPEAYNNLATLYARQGRLNEAKELLERALRTDPRYAAIYENLSSVYVELARNSYAKALRLEDNTQQAPRLQMLTAWMGPSVMASGTVEAEPVKVASVAAARPVAAAPSAPVPAPVVVAKVEPARPQPAPAAVARVEPTRPQPAPAVVPPAAPAAPEVPGVAKVESAESQPPPVAAAPAVEPSPAPAVPEAQRLAVINALQGWAKAWSQQNLEAYLAYYEADYAPEGSSREAWMTERRARLSHPAWIKISLEAIEVQAASADEAVVTLTQRYATPGYKDTTLKRLSLSLRDGNWMIGEETNLKVTR